MRFLDRTLQPPFAVADDGSGRVYRSTNGTHVVDQLEVFLWRAGPGAKPIVCTSHFGGDETRYTLGEAEHYARTLLALVAMARRSIELSAAVTR